MNSKIRKSLLSFISIPISILISIQGLTVSSFAHNGDVFSGTYTSSAICNQSNLNFKINSSAQTSLLTYNVYNKANTWSSTSSNVSVNVVMSSPGMPTYGFYNVYGKEYSDGTFGSTIPHDSNGNIVGVNDNWNSVTIYINTKSGTFADSTAASKTFIHEVGHALKLKHPSSSFAYSGHTYEGGLPKAIMNQGAPNSNKPWIATSIQTHDKNNITAKWGG